MEILSRIWFALERMPGPAAVLPFWRRLLGAEFDLAARWLRPTSRRAASFPRLDGAGEPYRVVVHGPGDTVGVCPDGDRIELQQQDLIVWELDRRKLLEEIASAFGLARGGDGTSCIGEYRPLAGFSVPVHFVLERTKEHFERSVSGIALKGRPCIIASPTRQHWSTGVADLLEGQRSMLLALNESVSFAERGGLEATDAGKLAISRFQSLHVPAPDDPQAPALFPTPADASWRDLRLRFVDGHRVSVSVMGLCRVLQYSDIGMSDGRNGQPTKQWEFLRILARGGGALRWGDRGADVRNRKRRELLTRDLKAFFRIEGEPIELTADGKGWETVFAIALDE